MHLAPFYSPVYMEGKAKIWSNDTCGVLPQVLGLDDKNLSHLFAMVWSGFAEGLTHNVKLLCCVPLKLLSKSLERTREDVYSPKHISAQCLENGTWTFNLFQQLLMELRCFRTNMDVHLMAQSTGKKQQKYIKFCIA